MIGEERVLRCLEVVVSGWWWVVVVGGGAVRWGERGGSVGRGGGRGGEDGGKNGLFQTTVGCSLSGKWLKFNRHIQDKRQQDTANNTTHYNTSTAHAHHTTHTHSTHITHTAQQCTPCHIQHATVHFLSTEVVSWCPRDKLLIIVGDQFWRMRLVTLLVTRMNGPPPRATTIEENHGQGNRLGLITQRELLFPLKGEPWKRRGRSKLLIRMN